MEAAASFLKEEEALLLSWEVWPLELLRSYFLTVVSCEEELETPTDFKGVTGVGVVVALFWKRLCTSGGSEPDETRDLGGVRGSKAC